MNRRRALPAGFVVVNTLLLWLAIGIASVALWPIYESTAIVLLVGVTTLAGSAVAIAGAVWRFNAAVVTGATVLVFLVLGVPLAVPGEASFGVVPSIDGLLQLVGGVALGWKRLLTITLPVGSYQALLVPAFVLVLLVSVVSLTVALRSGRAGLAVVGPLALFLAALALGPATTLWPVAVTLSLVTVTLVWLMWQRWYARREAIRLIAATAVEDDGTQAVVPSEHRLIGGRTIVAAAVILGLAGAAGVAAVAVVPPQGGREVLRSGLVQPFDPRLYVSPLAGFRKYLQSPEDTEVLFTVAGLPAGGRIRIATLDTYDGVVYSVGSSDGSGASGAFTRVPYRFDQSAVHGTQVSLDVSIADYSGVWVPTVGQLESLEFAGARAATLQNSFYYNDTAGTAAVIGGVRSGDSYRVSAIVPTQPSSAILSTLRPGSVTVPPIGVLPAQTEVALDGYVDGVTGAGNRLVAMLAGLAANGYISHGLTSDEPPSRSGHSADRITELLTGQRMIGDAEQYSVAAALMARQLGFPTRVVFGFAPDASGAVTMVRGSSVSAWIEVNTEQYGWVTIDPTPPVREIPEALPETPTTVSRPQSVIPPPAVEPDRPDVQTPQEASQDSPTALPAWIEIALVVLTVAGWISLAAAIVASPLLVIVAIKARRRARRKRASNPLARISGGWLEYRDAIVDHGLVPSAAATRREIAAAVGGSQPAILAAIADRAMFAPREPSDAEADKVWKAVAELSAKLDRGTTRWQRLKARVSLRSLGSLAAARRRSAVRAAAQLDGGTGL